MYPIDITREIYPTDEATDHDLPSQGLGIADQVLQSLRYGAVSFFFLFFFLGEIQDDNYFLLNKTFQNNITYHTWGLFVDIGDASIWR